MSGKTKDFLIAIALLVIGIGAIVIINMEKEYQRIESGAKLTYATLPSIYAGLLIFLVVIFLIQTLRVIKTERSGESVPSAGESGPKNDDVQATPVSRRVLQVRTVGTLIVLLIYVSLLEYVHFMINTTLFLGIMFWLYGQRSLKKIVVVSLIGSTAFYFLFIYILDVPI
ncbi:MAG: tripartite tricarboxylate transporter TctB family protein [Syntrophobacterales bacterium]|nr:tripartite tricarboxylate transporter TctB family protein [Syntrophobacterales bacterium]